MEFKHTGVRYGWHNCLGGPDMDGEHMEVSCISNHPFYVEQKAEDDLGWWIGIYDPEYERESLAYAGPFPDPAAAFRFVADPYLVNLWYFDVCDIHGNQIGDPMGEHHGRNE